MDNNAFMGLLITPHPPTAGMRERAGESERRLGGKRCPKAAILTYGEVLAGKFREALPYALAIDLQSGSQTGLDLSRS